MADGRARPEVENATAPRLESLAASYSEELHSTYFEILRRALDEQSSVHNIALAGTYGAGKSSVLRKVRETYPKRVIQVSLLTLGARDQPVAAAEDGNPAASTTTNRIQKEIVKQLLYQQSPSEAPDSRFRRITRFRGVRETFLALAVGVAALGVIVATGLDSSLLGLKGLGLPAWLQTLTSYLAIVVAGAVLAFTVRMLMQGRLGIEKVTAGPATITLPPRSSSYFDEYLDEIIYYFETNKHKDVLIIEDLDRFNNASIFEALRSLNGLLNSAKQLEGRNIRFIYAVRDSVFENHGRDHEITTGDEVLDELVRANRTKFFELIVPVVPFITHRNARDLMHDLLTKRGHKISKDVLDVVARHVADMRLIHNIVNEYEVYKHRLIDVPNPVPELDPDRLFALIVFKNTRMADFEAIRLGTSSLDKLYDTWRDLVSDNLQRLRDENTRLARRIDRELATTERAAKLGAHLIEHIDVLVQAPGSPLTRQIQIGGSSVTDKEMKTVDFWRRLIANEHELTLNAPDVYGHPKPVRFSFPSIRTWLPHDLDLDAFQAGATANDRNSIDRNNADIAFLSRRTWNGLFERADLTYASEEKGTERSLRDWAQHLTRSRLTTDLVIHGYITPYFALHISSFYGQIVRPAAMTYIMRNVDHGTADPDFPLDAEDVETLLRDQGRSFLQEPSAYNVSILDHLLVERRSDAEILVKRLATQGTAESEFLSRYLSAGQQKHALIVELVKVMPNIFVYLAETAPGGRDERAALTEAAARTRDGRVAYDYPPEVRTFVEAAYVDFRALTKSVHSEETQMIVQFVVDTGAVLPNLLDVSEQAGEAFAHTQSYRVTVENIWRVTRSWDIALDNLGTVPMVREHVLNNITDYLDAVDDQHSNATWTVMSCALFIEALKSGDTWTREDFDRFIHRAGPDCRIDQLRDVPVRAWPALVREKRAPASFENVAAYIEWQGVVDENLAPLLASADDITNAPADETVCKELATVLVNAEGTLLDVEQKIALALSLKPGTLPTSPIEPEAVSLIGDLIAEGLIEDDEEAFSSRLMTDWPTFEHAASRSQKFSDFVGPSTMSAAFVAPLMRSAVISNAVKRAVVNALSQLGEVSPDAYQAVTDSALRGEHSLRAAFLQQLHQGGASTDSVIELLAKGAARYTEDELRDVLRAMSDSYAVIADPGTKRPALADTPAHRTILEKLQAFGIVAHFPSKNGTLRVSLRHS